MESKYEEFKTKFINTYYKVYNTYLKKNIDDAIEEFRVEINAYDTGDIDVIHKKNLKSIYFLKRRWTERYFNNKNLLKELESMKFEYTKVLSGIKPPEQFKEYYGVDNDTKYIETINGKIEIWKNDNKSRLSQFPYLYNLDYRSIKTALKYDLLIEYYESLTKVNEVKKEGIKRIPGFLATLAIDPTNKKRLIDDKEEVSMNGEYIEIFSYISEEEKELLLVQLEKDAYLKLKQGKNVQDIVTQMALLKATDTMNNYDSKILSYIYTCFYNDILAESITKKVTEIMMEIELENNTSNRNKVLNSIIKLSKLNLEYEVNTEHLSGSLFDAYIKKEEKTKETNITIQLGPFFKSLIYMNEGYNFNKKAYDDLNSDSQHYALWFQKRRIKLCGEGSNSETIHVNNVMGAILWNTTRYDRRLKRVLVALEELKKNQLIIKDFNYNKKAYEFEIKYLELPIRIQERIKNHDFKTSEIVEGGIEILQ